MGCLYLPYQDCLRLESQDFEANLMPSSFKGTQLIPCGPICGSVHISRQCVMPLLGWKSWDQLGQGRVALLYYLSLQYDKSHAALHCRNYKDHHHTVEHHPAVMSHSVKKFHASYNLEVYLCMQLPSMSSIPPISYTAGVNHFEYTFLIAHYYVAIFQ